ncbi:hypothetical protein CALCODRAFT_308464 [Calocera cornea HHB12733]|uniref:Uncharacterized protein n=1 Tax=Calocera cornea HHB12733 TaxID=1353952 RepID=A0A165FGN3_9BASI|nr:hypothetical protein CALCODRAFT_308464 [Calocera cornea HHB12733]
MRCHNAITTRSCRSSPPISVPIITPFPVPVPIPVSIIPVPVPPAVARPIQVSVDLRSILITIALPTVLSVRVSSLVPITPAFPFSVVIPIPFMSAIPVSVTGWTIPITFTLAVRARDKPAFVVAASCA